MSQDLPELPPHAFQKAAPSDDGLFYGPARLVTHIDDAATAALTRFYASRLRRLPSDRFLPQDRLGRVRNGHPGLDSGTTAQIYKK